ncbi:MAG TPA: hypothetical protein VJ796_03945 [Acidimicrobiia bacterium]|nr:hypothetical protein [Acidimicrobiia bacterium]
MNRWPLAAVVVSSILALLVLLLGVLGVVAMTTIGRLNDDVLDLSNQLASAESRIADLEDELASAPDNGASGLEDLLGGLLRGEGSGDLDDLLGDLFAGAGGDLGDLFGEDGLGSLLGGANPDLGSCLTAVPGSIEIANDNLEAQIDDIALAVSDIRELEFTGDVDPILVSPEEMGERVRDLAAEELPADVVEFDTRLWVGLRMLDPGFDLVETQLDLLDSAVAGYYDPDSNDLVVATTASDSPLDPIDQVTLAHELIHALTDSNLNFPDIIDDPRADPERVRAIQALIEGDATLGMQQFSLGAIDLMDQFGMILDPRLAASQADLDEVPYILSNGLQLPYLEGMSFACALYADGGWEAVDAAYDNPPDTTAEILFPELYQDGWEPETPAAAGGPGAGWSELGTAGFGAVDLLNLFSAPSDDTSAGLDDVRERVRSWGGGTATVWARDSDTAILLNLVDSGAGTTSLCESMEAWVRAAAVENAKVDCQDTSVQVGIGPNLDISDSIVD